MTHEQFIAVMTREMYIWRMARANGRKGSPDVVAKAEARMNMAVLERAATLEASGDN